MVSSEINRTKEQRTKRKIRHVAHRVTKAYKGFPQREFVVHGGWISSGANQHYISAREVARLYKIPLCKIVRLHDERDTHELNSSYWLQFPDKVTHIYPDETGKYEMEK